jgi:uncharacterized protein (DUF1697 family)
MPATHVALLRGINVGGKNKLPMKSLATMFVAAGCKEVQTYIQSGNVVFHASDEVARMLPERVGRAGEVEFGFPVRLVLRTAAQMRTVVTANPFDRADLVYFLADTPSASDIAKLDPMRSPSDTFRVVGDEIYLQVPTGLADTKLTTAYFDSRLKTMCTGRNWNTVLKLVEMLEG